MSTGGILQCLIIGFPTGQKVADFCRRFAFSYYGSNRLDSNN